VIIFASGFHHPLYRVNAMGGEPKALTSLDRSRQEQVHIFPQFLPDGEHFIYLSESAKPENSGTYLGSLDSPKRKRIHDGLANAVYAPPGYLIFRTGTSLMARRFDFRRAEVSGDPLRLVDGVATGNPPFYSIFSVSENGILAYLSLSMLFDITELVWCDRTGRRLGTVASPAAYSNPAISPDQKKIAVAKWDTQTNTRDIWIIDFERRNSSRLTFDPADDTNPTWSPDGTRIAFSSNRKGHFDIYVKPASGVGDERQLIESGESKYIEDWSGDGEYLAYGTNTGEWVYSFKQQKSMLLLRGGQQDQVRFFPKRAGPLRWFAYESDESGQFQVYVRSFAGALSGSGGKWQVSLDGGSEPYWRVDGKELFYVQGNKLMAVEINAGAESFQMGAPKELFESRLPRIRKNRYDVTSDGRRFLVNAWTDQKRTTNFRVVLNWPALLKH
jgi:Tol biopolymer transport system component